MEDVKKSKQSKQEKINIQENRRRKWVATRANACDKTVRNRLKKIRFTWKESKRKPALTPKQQKISLQVNYREANNRM